MSHINRLHKSQLVEKRWVLKKNENNFFEQTKKYRYMKGLCCELCVLRVWTNLSFEALDFLQYCACPLGGAPRQETSARCLHHLSINKQPARNIAERWSRCADNCQKTLPDKTSPSVLKASRRSALESVINHLTEVSTPYLASVRRLGRCSVIIERFRMSGFWQTACLPGELLRRWDEHDCVCTLTYSLKRIFACFLD